MYAMDFISNASARVILSLAMMMLAGFLMTRLTKKLHLPNVTGYILAGVVLGPSLGHLISPAQVEEMGFVTDLALAFIAFGVGRYFKFSQLRQNGGKVVVITILEALTAAVLVTLCMVYVFHLSWSFALLLGAIGSATAPASTIMTIRQYKAKGSFVNLILQVVALDDAVALIAFSICAAVAQAMEGGGVTNAGMILWPIAFNLAALILGGIAGYVLHRMVDGNRSSDHRLILTVAILFVVTGICTAMDISPLLACMVLGTVYINVGGSKRLFKRMNKFTPPILMLFFILSGMRLDLHSLAAAGIIGVAYFLVRIVGKYLGAFAGTSLCRMPKTTRRCLGLALIPQAGVSIGLAVLGQRILPTEMGVLLSTIILSSGLLYEMVGPACAKASLFLSHTIGRDTPKVSEPAQEDVEDCEALSPKPVQTPPEEDPGKKEALAHCR